MKLFFAIALTSLIASDIFCMIAFRNIYKINKAGIDKSNKYFNIFQTIKSHKRQMVYFLILSSISIVVIMIAIINHSIKNMSWFTTILLTAYGLFSAFVMYAYVITTSVIRKEGEIT